MPNSMSRFFVRRKRNNYRSIVRNNTNVKNIIKIFEKGYRVSVDGKEVLTPLGDSLTLLINPRNYTYFNLNDLNIKYISVHQLQAYQKFGEKALYEGIYVCHLDNNTLNNHIDNIIICTGSEMNRHRKSPALRKAVSEHVNYIKNREDLFNDEYTN